MDSYRKATANSHEGHPFVVMIIVTPGKGSQVNHSVTSFSVVLSYLNYNYLVLIPFI
ncbi:hypothetical protein J31TS6_27640 [Brevibacillus reuszeri]|nr:hypothetical protein J31TS6_27640 [Brevibacillus reuszeri]